MGSDWLHLEGSTCGQLLYSLQQMLAGAGLAGMAGA